MKTATTLKGLILLALFFLSERSFSQNPVNWTKDQLLEPHLLAQALKTNKNVPVIISIGPGALIPGSIDIGSVENKNNLDKLSKKLKTLKKDAAVVVYCGCCPYERCPNVRPAVDLLKKMNFAHFKLLDLPRNIKADWLDKGYPRTPL